MEEFTEATERTPDRSSVGSIRVFCYFRKKGLMSVISCSSSLMFWLLSYVISIPFCPKTSIGPKVLKK